MWHQLYLWRLHGKRQQPKAANLEWRSFGRKWQTDPADEERCAKYDKELENWTVGTRQLHGCAFRLERTERKILDERCWILNRSSELQDEKAKAWENRRVRQVCDTPTQSLELSPSREGLHYDHQPTWHWWQRRGAAQIRVRWLHLLRSWRRAQERRWWGWQDGDERLYHSDE